MSDTKVKTERDIFIEQADRIAALESQLAEARAEVERLSQQHSAALTAWDAYKAEMLRLRGLLREASRAMSEWHLFYGKWCNRAGMEEAMPPAGNVELQERIDAAIDAARSKPCE